MDGLCTGQLEVLHVACVRSCNIDYETGVRTDRYAVSFINKFGSVVMNFDTLSNI
jgi:hypothetical protein